MIKTILGKIKIFKDMKGLKNYTSHAYLIINSTQAN